MIRRIRELLYDQGFTISGARNRLQDQAHGAADDAQLQAPAVMAVPDNMTPVVSVRAVGMFADGNCGSPGTI